MPITKLNIVAAYVLFIDIVGFSLLALDEQVRQMEVLEESARGAEEFNNAGSDLTPASSGDGFALAFFNDYQSPLRCAIEISSKLKDHPQIKVRMGLNQGPVRKIPQDIAEKPNVTGDGINMAQRVMDCGDSGHILVSGNMADVLLRLTYLKPYLRDLGEVAVKHDIRIRIYNYYDGQVGNPDVPRKIAAQTSPAATPPVAASTASTPIRSSGTVPFIPPLSLFDSNTFVGRDKELEQLKACLIDGDNKVCCISVGDIAGGIGKTTLAHVFASTHRADFPDGIISVRVDKKSTIALAHEFASYCHAEDRPHDEEDATALMRRTFGDRRMLLIFDNAEKSRNIRDLLPGGDKCAVIITTRRRELGSALGTSPDHEIELGVLERGQAKDLLGRLIGVERVRNESTAADEIVDALSYLPLAIRIAGMTLLRGTSKYKSLSQYASDLENKRDRWAKMSGGDSSDPNLSLKASITLSLVALENDEQVKFFLRLSACSEQRFSVTEALAANNYAAEWVDKARGILERLYDFALVNVTAPTASGAERFVLHPLIYLYAYTTAENRHGDAGGDNLYTEAVWSHAEFYRSYFASRDASDAALAAFVAEEMDGIITAARHWYGANLTTDASNLSDAILKVLDRQNRPKAVEFIYALLEAAREMNDAEAEVNLRIGLASRLSKENLFGMARDELAPIAGLIFRLGDKAQLDCTARWKNTLAVALQHLNDLAGAETAIGECIEARQQQGGGKNLAFAYNTQGIILDLLGRREDALKALDKSIGIRTKDDPRNLPFSLLSKAKLLREIGKDAEAKTLVEQAYASFKRDNNSSGQAQALTEFGNNLLEEGRDFFPDAMDAFASAKEIEIKDGNRSGLAIVLTGIGRAYLYTGNDPARATASLDEAFRIEEDRRHARGLIIVLRLLARALRRANRAREIDGYLSRALAAAPSDAELKRLCDEIGGRQHADGQD